MYIPPHQYIRRRATELPALEDSLGNAVTRLSNIVETSTGRFFKISQDKLAQGDFKDAQELFRTLSTVFENIPVSNKVIITDNDRIKGEFNRYFQYNTSTGRIKEINREEVQNITLSVYETIETLPWVIKGPVKDRIIDNIRYQGLESRNKKAVEKLSKVIPGILNTVTDFSEFALTQEIEEIPVEPQKDSFYIPSPSKKL